MSTLRSALGGWILVAATLGGCDAVPHNVAWSRVPNGTIVLPVRDDAVQLPDDQGPTWTTDAMRAPEQVSASGCTIFLALVLWLPGAYILAVALHRRRRHSAAAAFERGWKPDAPLADGPCAVFGEVVSTSIDPVAVATLHERYVPGKGGGLWQETTRTLIARPFTLRLSGGREVSVEPGVSIEIRRPLRTRPVTPFVRQRIAEIGRGDRVHVFGALGENGGAPAERAYREAPSMPVLRAPASGPMVISTEAPAVAHEEAARRARRLARMAVGTALVAQLVGFGDWTLLTALGSVHTARVTDTAHWVARAKGSPLRHSAVRVVPDGASTPRSLQSSDEFAYCAESFRCRSVRVVTAPVGLGAALGTRPTFHFLRAALLGAVLAIAWLFIVLDGDAQGSAWYIRRRIRELS